MNRFRVGIKPINTNGSKGDGRDLSAGKSRLRFAPETNRLKIHLITDGSNKMKLHEFVNEYRTELYDTIWESAPNWPINDAEVQLWIANDEGLYNWALESGVDPEDI